MTTRTILVAAEEEIGCPKCTHAFPLSEGISRTTIERYAEDFERSLAERRTKLETELAEATGSVREVITRTLRSLKAAQLISTSRDEVAILDPAGLAELAETF